MTIISRCLLSLALTLLSTPPLAPPLTPLVLLVLVVLLALLVPGVDFCCACGCSPGREYLQAAAKGAHSAPPGVVWGAAERWLMAGVRGMPMLDGKGGHGG